MTNKEAAWHLGTYSTTMGSGQTTDEQHNEAKRIAIKALEQELCREQDDYENEIEDLHNRLNIAEGDKEGLREEVTRLEEKIKTLEPKTTGHWIADEVQLPDRVVLNYHCSVCGRKLVGYSTETLKDAPYCHCGAKMEG